MVRVVGKEGALGAGVGGNCKKNRTPPNKKLTHIVPTAQLVKMSIDPKFVELTADVLKIFSYMVNSNARRPEQLRLMLTYPLVAGIE